MRKTTITFSAAYRIFVVLLLACTGIVQLQAQIYPFTTCGATGTNGPTQAQVNLAYASTPITLVTSNNGIQEWSVPATGLYSIKVAGAKGGGAGGGNGAVMSGEFLLTQGHVIQIVVGQRGTGGFGSQGSFNSGGGGGGSYVINKTTGTILIIAGGGGGGNGDYGSSYPNTAGNPANTGTSGNSTCQTGGGINGNGGRNGITDDPAAGGGGYFTNGENSPGAAFATGGFSFLNGARGGAGRAGSFFGGDGGFGGGGGGTSNILVRGGGGGGYSGGQGGTYQIAQTSIYTSSNDRGHGAGGGSINNGTNPQIFATNASSGYVTVTTLATPAGALNFVKANNNYITVPHSATLNLGAEFTIEAWVNYTGVNSTIIDKGNYNYLLQVNCNNPGFAPNKLNFYNRNTGWVHSTGTVPEGVWTHVAVTLKNGTMTFYINGVASGTAAVTFAQDNGPVNIGRQSPSSCACNIFNGNMDELRVWNRALSSCEINTNKGCELNGAQTGLAAYYKFNQGNVNNNNSAVNTLTDASGNNNTGTLTNFTLSGATSNWVAGQVSGTCAVYTTPNANITGNLVICSGATTQLNNTIAGGVWSSSNNAVATVNTSGLVTGVSAGTTTITYTNNCGGVSTATVTVNASPTASINAVGSTTLCAGSAITLNANTGAGLTYQWRLNGNPISGATNANYIANAVGSYTVVTTQSGCSTTSNAVTISADQIPPVAVCKDVNLTLNASGTASIIIPATTTTLLYENWSGDNQGYYANTSTLNWNVTGDIDRADYVSGMPGIEIDLSGFGNGTIETKQTFNFTPGTYTISFLQVANTLGGNAVKVDIGSLFSQTFVTALTISSESATFTVTSNTSATLKFTQLGTSDPAGSFVGQIRLVRNDAETLAIENGSTDNCSIASITASKTNFTCADIGTNIVTLTVTDVNGNVATCQATVTVTDNIAPVMSAAPSNITVNATSASGALINYTTPTATDNCPVTVSLISGLASGSTFPVGTTTVTYRATDASGNSAQSSFTVTVIGVAPQIVSPGNQTAAAAQGTCGATVNFAATETTAIPASTITYSHQPGSVFPVGVTTVTATATNAVGTSQATFTVTVNDVTPPSIVCASNITVNAPSNACSANVTVTSPVVSDNCATSNYAEIAAPFNANATNLSLWIDATKFSTSNGGGLNGVMNDASGKRSVSTTATYETAGFNGRPSVRYNNNQTATSAFSTNGNTYVFTTVQIVAPTNNWASVFYHLNRDGGLTIEQNPFSPNSAPSGTAQYHFQTGNDNANVERNITYGVHYIMAAKITGGNVRSFTLYRDNNGVLQNLGTSTNSAFTLSIGNGGLFIGRSDIGSEFTNMRMGEFIYFQNDMPSGVTEASVIDYLYQKWLYNNSVSLTNSFNGTSNASGTYPVGTTNVTWTATDAYGNTSTCQQTVTVVDNTAPQFTSCPSNITVNATSAAGAVVNYSTPVGTDNCSGAVTALTSGLPSGSTFPIGTTTVTYRATDASGNTANCSFTVTVSGAAPVIVCPTNISVNSAAGQCGANVNFAATETTGIPASVITYSHTPGSFFPVGTTTVTATATNAVGTTSCTFTITVQDVTPPVLGCTNQSSSNPVNFMRGTSTGGTASVVSWGAMNGAFQYGGSSLGTNCNELWRPFGTLCDEGPNTNSMTTSTKQNQHSGITWNNGGGTGIFIVDLGATQTFNLAQVYQMFSDGKTTHVRGFYHPSTSATPPSLTDAGWVEMFPETLIGAGVLSGNNVTQPTNITFNATTARYIRFYARNDGRYGSSGYIETRSIKLFNTAPAVNNVVVTVEEGQCTAIANYDIQALDNCSGTVVTYSIPSGSSFPIGTTPVTVTATDASGNVATCSFSVIVNAPEINVTGNTNNIPSGTTTTSAANNTNLGGTLPNVSVSKNFVVQNTGTAALKVNSINLSGVDASAFNVTGITLPATIAPNATANFNVVFNSNTPGIKNATVTIQNTDCNEAAYQFAITAEITCTDPVFVNQNPQVQATTTTTTCNAVVNYPLSVNGIPAPALTYSFSGATTGSGAGTGTGQTFNLGTTHVTVTAVNSCSTVVYEFDVIVRDITAPTAIAQNLTINLSANGTASITAAQVNNGSNDNCGIATIVLDKTNFDCGNVGANTVVLTVTDVNGNSSTATATITVVDNIAPTAIAQNLTITLSANGTASITAAQVNNGSNDNCGIATIVLDKTNFDCGNVGANTVVLTVTDVNGNSSTVTATITVVDNIAPTAIAQNLTINLSANGTASITAAQVNNGSNDNCGIATIALDKTNFDCSNVGANTVVLTVTDVNGNSSTATATVTVVDNIAPTITAPANINQGTDIGLCGAVVSLGSPITSDNCSIASILNDAPAVFPVGTTIVTWTVTDVNGNTNTATQTVVVNDTEKPKIKAPALVSVVNTPGLCTATVDLGTPVTSDNCGVASVSNDAPAVFPVGTTIVTWTVTDIHGNITDTAKQKVVVIDNENPTISVTDISVNNDAGLCSASLTIALPTTGDNCGVAAVMGVRSDNQLLTAAYPVGTTTITWTVRDVNGNTRTAIQTIVVTDQEKPVIACASNQVFCANTGGNTQYTIPVLTQSDNCGIASTTYTITGATNRNGTGTNASGSFAIGTSTVTFTVTDIHGNVSTCSFTVTINPLPVASITTTSQDALCNQLVLTANSTLSGPFTYQWLYNNTTKATTQQLSLGLSDADGVYSVYATNANGCRSELPATYNYQKQNLVSSYTILATKEVKLGQYNKVESGSVGVMSSRGEAEFEKYSSVTGAGSFVKAPRIDTDKKGVTINSKIYGVVSVSLPTMQYNTSSTRYLQDVSVSNNTTLNGNYDDVTVKKGANVTLTGTIFGKVKLEEGASVRFTSTTINLEELQIEKGPKSGGYSYIRFAPNTSVRVTKKVTIGSDVIVNPEAYQVTFYLADNKRDEEKFHVKGDDTRITANIILPDGKLKVTGGNYGDDKCDHRAHSSKDCKHKGHGHHDCDHRSHGDRDCRDDVFMTGLFIAEEVESEGKNVIWNSYNCSAPAAPVTVLTSNNSQTTITEEGTSFKQQAATRSEEELKVTVMPNPTRTYFTLKLESKYDAPVTLRVIDASGRAVESRAKLGANSTVQIGHNYQTGNYFAEFIQGNRRKVVQLIKVK